MRRFAYACATAVRWQRLLALGLAAVFMLSAAVSGTAAWKDFSQHKTNAVRGNGDAQGAEIDIPVPGGEQIVWQAPPTEEGPEVEKAVTGAPPCGEEAGTVSVHLPHAGGDEIVLRGKKTWNHGSNPIARRPASITVILKADGEVVTQRLITAAEHWSWAFRLPKHNGEGKEIVYTVDEARFEDYVKTVDGYNLINTYQPGGNTGGIYLPGEPPKTGDESRPAFWLVSMALSFAALVMLIVLLFPWNGSRRFFSRRRPKRIVKYFPKRH